MTKRPFQKKHLIQVFVGGGSLALMYAGIDSDFSWWPGLILVGLGGIIAIAKPRRQTVADWIVRWTGRLPKMSKSLYLIGAGMGVFIFTLALTIFIVVIVGWNNEGNVGENNEEHHLDGLIIGIPDFIPIAGTLLGLVLIGSGTIWALVDTILAYNHKRQFKPGQTDNPHSRAWIALLAGLLSFFAIIGIVIGFIIFVVWLFLNSLPGGI
jgi:Mn2+/Fe2+ NRAMP family transporter